MKKIVIFVLAFLFVASCVGFVACATNSVNYKVTFESGGGSGTAPTVEPKQSGEEFQLPDNTFTYDGYEFTGWKTGEEMYLAGDKFTMPENDVVFTAQWREEVKTPVEAPVFSRTEYSYDRYGGGPLGLPFYLNGWGLFYVKVGDERLPSSLYSYDEQKECLVIEESYFLTLADGRYLIKAITDADQFDVPQCTVETYNSLKTSFDENTEREFVFGKDSEICFDVNFNGATVSELRQGDYLVDAKYYKLDGEKFIVSADWLQNIYAEQEFYLKLSNNDCYTFKVQSNVTFYSDYDVTTIHSDVQSNIGHNPLYQYYDNVKIVEAPEDSGMQGKVLQYTPNTSPEDSALNGLFTMKQPSNSMMWYDGGFTAGHYYAISFDYMTEGTSVGDFFYGSVTTSWRDDLLLGAANDGVVHHYSKVVSFEEIGEGVWMWAYFNGGGGKIYVDNMRIVELDEIPSVDAEADYGMKGDCEIDFWPYGYQWELYKDDVRIENAYYNSETGKLVLPEEYVSALEVGTHNFTVVFPFFQKTFVLRIEDSRVVQFVETRAEYKRDATGDLKLYGTFDESVELESFKQMPKSSDNGYAGWEFVATDFEQEYKEKVTFVPGAENAGYLLLSEKFLNNFYGETVFSAEFSNGKNVLLTITTNALMVDNKDESYLWGTLNGTSTLGSPLNSGLNGAACAAEVRDDGMGNHAFYVTSTEGAEDTSIYTVKMHDHVWTWYKVQGNGRCLYRVMFDYKLTGFAEKEVYFVLIHAPTEDKQSNFFGNGYEAVVEPAWEELRWYLTADGETHTLDTGWFTWTDNVRLMRIALPSFTAADGKEVMIDNYTILENEDSWSGHIYGKGQEESFKLPLGGYTLNGATIDGNAVNAEQEEDFVVFSNAELDALDEGNHVLILKTNAGDFRIGFQVTGGGTAILQERVKSVVRGGGAVKLSGVFTDSLTVTSIMRQGTNDWDTSRMEPKSMNASYITVQSDGLLLSEELIDQAYGTTKYTVTLSNGAQLSFTLESNVLHFTNYDETYVQEESQGNVRYCQDTAMAEVVEYNGGHAIKYTPANATLPHSVGANNGTAEDNGIFTFSNGNVNAWFWTYDFSADAKYEIFFDYEIVCGEKASPYKFQWADWQVQWHDEMLEGSGTFRIILDGGDLLAFRICCPVATPDGNSGTYMMIDNFGFAKVVE